MAFEKALVVLKNTMDDALKLDDKDLVVPEDQKIVSRSRHDDDVTGGDLALLQTRLSDDIGFRQFRQQAAKVDNARDLWERRGKELKLLFTKKVANQRIADFWSREYAANVVRSGDFQKQQTEEGNMTGDDMVSANRSGDSPFADYIPDSDRGGISDRRYEKKLERERGGPSSKSTDTGYKFAGASTGASGPLIKLHISDDDPSRLHSTDNLIQRVVDSLKGDDRTLKVLFALLLRWKIELPTFMHTGTVPAAWDQMQKEWEKDEELYSKNLRKFLEQVGYKDFRQDSPQVRKLQETLLTLTDTKDEAELRSILVEAVKNTGDYGGFAKSKNDSDDAFAQSELKGDGKINESSSVGDILGKLESISERAPSARELKAFRLLDEGIQSGDIAMRMQDWQFVIPAIVWVNRRKNTAAWRRAVAFTKQKRSAMVSKTLRQMFADKPKDKRIMDILQSLITAPINESMAAIVMLDGINESFHINESSDVPKTGPDLDEWMRTQKFDASKLKSVLKSIFRSSMNPLKDYTKMSDSDKEDTFKKIKECLK